MAAVEITVIDHPLVAHKLTVLRDAETDSPTFRRLTEELVTLLAYEATREVRVAERICPLRRRESLVLETLLLANGRLVVRDVLQERLYGLEDEVTPNALETAVSRLRRALAVAGSNVWVETQRGLGYRVVARACA